MTPGDLTPLARARELALANASPLGSESVALGDALGRVLGADATARDTVPGFDNSAMDGFAVQAGSTIGAGPDAPVELRIVGESRAGNPAALQAGKTLGAGEAIRISTGAVLPPGADAVVRVEATRPEGTRPDDTNSNDTHSRGERVLVLAAVEPGRDVRRAGEDIAAGERVLGAGTRIGPAELGVLASIGSGRVECFRRPRVSLITGGDELLGPNEALRPGAVRDSNRYSIGSLIARSGADLASAERVPDDLAAIRAALEVALDADLVVVCGGVSVGDHDHVKAALADLEVEEIFWKIALKPGKPTWFGRRGSTLVFGLPGNPVSAMVTFLLFARPVLSALQGERADRQPARAVLAEGIEGTPDRAHAVRCSLTTTAAGLFATPTGPQGSHILTSMLGADCLAIVPEGVAPVAGGETVEIEMIDGVGA
ncbi:MAG TPA: gephyrin-like molybdotransferase Glp [Solirubrobacterales bacterium]|nr:gephyrin-like molybdotransferase Glp [Solirubrobacterales bacterium]